MTLLKLFAVAILILLTAFFVAAEFAIVKIRKSRIDQLAEEGNKRAISAQKVIENLDGSLSACQLGITITALGLGWLGEPTVEAILGPVFKSMELSAAVVHTLSFAIAFSSITFLHVVLGELAPKTIAIQKAESISLMLSPALISFYRVMYPFIWFLNGSAQLLVRLLGLKPASEHDMAHTEEELRLILSESYKSGEINKSEFSYVEKVFEFDDRTAKEIMVPRTEMVCMYLDNTMQENINIIAEEKYTRYPVVGEDKDHVLGMVNAKEIFFDLIKGKEFPLEHYIRPTLSVFENTPIKETLLKLQKKGFHMAVLVDEYGGTAGIVTIEDILEELVGEIRDEFDEDESPMIQAISPNVKHFDGKVLISEVNDIYGLDIDDSELDTIGGWVLSQNSEIQEQQVIIYEGYDFKVIELDGHQVKKIEVSKREVHEESDASIMDAEQTLLEKEA
ncbi:hemolysin family protein [Fictibacillus phosphorivorans]|uniref:hemolysin family protein n=1 Tax=Fictibacillus phosphorivorans TaxID=1221500 RepID=UPI002040B174|nr:hemolysin family protein [Fictibacillus phosphorivorans]MCM3719045.1 hemolysin family protein [Fictibacillus phosphorivorans]MCM3776667.1 hemolysin family protein [Fictibacillus phosphorivorans]